MAGGELPSARLVSERLAEVATSDDIRDKEDNNNNNNSELTVAVMLWGQLLAHDLGHTPEQVRFLFSIHGRGQLCSALVSSSCAGVPRHH